MAHAHNIFLLITVCYKKVGPSSAKKLQDSLDLVYVLCNKLLYVYS